jgi:hypothetical protein
MAAVACNLGQDFNLGLRITSRPGIADARKPSRSSEYSSGEHHYGNFRLLKLIGAVTDIAIIHVADCS